jgi:hypothetical protein
MVNEALKVPGAKPAAKPAAAARPRRWPLHADDVRGLLRLGVQAVTGATDVVEAMHHTIASRPAPLGTPPAGRTRGLTGFVYGAVRGTTRLVGHGLEWAGALLPDSDAPSTPRREAWRAALNGVQGDHLADSGNPLAIPMQLRIGGRPWREGVGPAPSGRILVLVHGLAMNDLQWSRHGHDHGQALARDAGWTPVYLHYNSGRHVAQNGREFSDQLAELVAAWPVPVRSWPSSATAWVAWSRAAPASWVRARPGGASCRAWSAWARRTMARRWSVAAAWSMCCWAFRPMPHRWPGWANGAAPASPICATATCRTPSWRSAAATTRPTTTAARHRCRAASRSTLLPPPRP